MPRKHHSRPVEDLVMCRQDHFEALFLIEDEMYKARAALQAGQVENYKARLQSAYISLQVLLGLGVGKK